MCGIVLEKAKEQFSQRRLVSGDVRRDMFGSFWNQVNVSEGTKTLLNIETEDKHTQA